MFRQKIALVYQVALSENIVKHDSPALARVDGTVEKFCLNLLNKSKILNDDLTCN